MVKLKTRRLFLVPMTQEDLIMTKKNESDPGMRQAYCEMLAGVTSHPRERLWYTGWWITLRRTGQIVGEFCFQGAAEHGAVEIGYGIYEDYRRHGYMTEALRGLIKWAFLHKDVIFVTAETLPENHASQGVLKKLKFVPDGMGEEGPRFIRETRRPKRWFSFTLLGAFLGLLLASFLVEIITETWILTLIGLGAAAGFIAGCFACRAEKQRRAELRRLAKQPAAQS